MIFEPFGKWLRLIPIGVLLLGCASVAADDEAPGPFVQSLINTGFRVDGYVTAPADDGEALLALIGRDQQQNRLLSAYPVDAGGRAGRPVARFRLPESFVFFDREHDGESMQLAFLATDGVWRYELAGHRLTRLTDVPSMYREATDGGLGHLDFVFDANGDGRDDLAVPDFEGYRLLLRDEEGRFSDPVLLEVPARMQMVERVHLPRGVPRYLRYALHNLDLSGDSRPDLGFIRENEFLVFVQESDGSFSTDPLRIPLALNLTPEYLVRALDSDDVDVDHSSLTLRQVQDLRDLNGDGVADFVVQATISSGVLDKRTEYHVYLGQVQDGQLAFGSEPDSVIRSDGFQFYLTKLDINADSRLDLVSPSIGFGVRQVIAALFTRKVGMDVAFFSMEENGTYPEKPVASRNVSVRFDLSSGYVDWPALAVADFDGDGLGDLLIQRESDELQIFPGNGSTELFADDAVKLRTTLPRDGERVDAVDIDADGRADIVMRYSSADGEKEALQFRVLMSR